MANGKRQTANGKQQTANGKWQTANSKRQTANGKQQNLISFQSLFNAVVAFVTTAVWLWTWDPDTGEQQG
ncbi:hypothetical protein EYC84_011546 [Monilinia fructicola]|uniref:Uncharacterized protein n=1 Tax=Monilinia fructicola TaxID=38448 RepID=A0A5M9JBH6_MONFR|nr:hypothetical protein EYC84_011546 [Monilinia fructicola]